MCAGNVALKTDMMVNSYLHTKNELAIYSYRPSETALHADNYSSITASLSLPA